MLDLRARQEIARTRGDRGEGPVSYIAVVLLIAAIVGVLVTNNPIGNTIKDGINNAVGKVLENGGVKK